MSELPAIDPGERLAMFLDLDGTLVEIAARPDMVEIPPRLVTALKAAHQRLDGALALISGRTIRDLDTLVAPLKLPAAGVHGLEYRNSSGNTHVLVNARVPDHSRQRLSRLAAAHDGLILEDKGDSVAMHFRLAPQLADRIRRELEQVVGELGSGFVIQQGKMVLELRPAGATKGTAIVRFMGEPPFNGRRPIFIGDDVTDEDGFQAVNRLEGISIRVGAQGETAARYSLPDVAAVLEWLESLTRQGCKI